MKRTMLLIALAAPLPASCPIYIKCSYHNVMMASKTDTEYRNGKEFGVYKHDYMDERGQTRKCTQIVECK